MQQTRLPASQSNIPFQVCFRKFNLVPSQTAPAATFLHRRSPSYSSDHLSASATTSSAPAATSPVPATTFLHQRSPSCTSNYQFCNSSFQSWTSEHLPVPAATSPESMTTFLHQQIPAATSPEPMTTFLHQQIPVLHQRPPIQRLTVWYQLSRPASETRSCSIDHHPAAATVRCTLFRFMIRHNKVWPFKATLLFGHSCLVRCQSLIFQIFAGTGTFIGIRNTHTRAYI